MHLLSPASQACWTLSHPEKIPWAYGQGRPSPVGLQPAVQHAENDPGWLLENCALRPLASPHPIERERNLNRAMGTKALGYSDEDKSQYFFFI